MLDDSFDATLIVPKLEPPPTRKLVVQFAAPARRRQSLWPWVVGAIVLALGALQPLERIDRHQLERAESAQAVLRSLAQ